MQRINVVGLEGFPLVKVGDNLSRMIVETARRENVLINSGDVIVVAQKVVSKAEGRVTRLRSVKPSERAEEVAKITLRDPKLVELALKEMKEIVKASQETLIVENKRGLICIIMEKTLMHFYLKTQTSQLRK